MTTTPPPDRGPTTPSPALMVPMRRLLRLGLLGTVLLLPLAAAVGLAVAGRPGLWAALLGAIVPIGFLGVTVVTAVVTARMSTTALGVVVLGSWLAKVVVLIGVLVVLRDADFYSRPVFGGTLLVGTIAALALEAVVVLRTRVPYVDGPR